MSQFKRTRAIALPILKLEFDTPYYIKPTKAIVTKQSVDQSSGEVKDIEVLDVINLADNESVQIVVPTVLKAILNEELPNESYIGKNLEIIKEKVQGKRYSKFFVYEVEIDEKKNNKQEAK